MAKIRGSIRKTRKQIQEELEYYDYLDGKHFIMDNNEYYVDLNKRDCKFFARNWRIENIEAFELTFGDHSHCNQRWL